MKNKFLQVMKTITVSVLAVSIVAVGSLSLPNGVKAAEVSVDSEDSTTGVRFVKFKNLDPSDYIGKTAPEYDGVDSDGVGYIFGGWYAKNGNTYEGIKNTDDLEAADEVVAKFVPAQTLSVKCQNWAGTKAGSDGVIVRVISAVDSTNYLGYGFEISRKEDNGWRELGTYDSKDNGKVYSKFSYYKNADDTTPTATYVPGDLFGKAAKHFTTCTVGRIPQSAHGTIICMKPFWKTLDGTKVYGLSKFAHVEDGYLNYINVPVNVNILNANNGAVAGMLNVKSTNGLKLVGVEYGKLFDEMETNTVTDSEGNVIVKCVGNTSAISAEAEKKAMDIYVNLRFQGVENDTTEVPHYTFHVTDEEFCDSTKKISTDDVWNIKY